MFQPNTNCNLKNLKLLERDVIYFTAVRSTYVEELKSTFYAGICSCKAWAACDRAVCTCKILFLRINCKIIRFRVGLNIRHGLQPHAQGFEKSSYGKKTYHLRQKMIQRSTIGKCCCWTILFKDRNVTSM
jgi:hypothetical protein